MTDKAPPCSPEAEMAVLGGMLIDQDAAVEAATRLEPEEFYVSPHRLLFKNLQLMVRRGEVLDEITVSAQLREADDYEAVGGVSFLASLLDAVPTAANIAYHVSVVKDRYAKRALLQVASKITESVEGAKWPAAKIVESALLRLGEIVPHQGQKVLTRQQIVVADRARIYEEVDRETRVEFHLPKLQEHVGPLIPGDTVAVPGFSNAGKTVFVANLARFWAVQGIPCKWYPTESAARFFSRVASAHARVDQRYAERDSWHLATPEEKEAYDFAVSDLERLETWDINPQRKISPEEIMADAARWRLRWKGRPVVIIVDHMHRLVYADGMPSAFAVEKATFDMRNWAGEDRHGGIILILLYQPKKPPVDVQVYKPVMGYGISGSGNVMAELDIILSPYRRWVKVEPEAERNPLLRTPWGSPRALLKNGHPVVGKPEAAGCKLDDEHMYVKLAKLRTGGEGPTLMFQMEKPSGYIYQVTSHREEPFTTNAAGGA